MEYQNLLIEIENDIAIVTINRAKALNAINRRTMAELRTFFTEDAPTRENLKGVIITGAGEKAFVAGADIKEFMDMDVAKGQETSQFGHDTYFAIERFPKPVIAAVNGFALGGGCELAMACHMRIAGEKAKFGQPEVNLGLTPGYGGTQRLIQLIGKGKAIELLLTTDMIKADEAHRLGLVNHVVPVGEEVKKAKEMIEKIATKGPMAVAGIIDSVNAYFQHDKDGFATEVQYFGETMGSDEGKEGAQAFIEKRKADFKKK